MKNTPKCPLCGGTPQFVTKDIDEIEVCQILCECGLGTEVNEFWLHPKDDPEEDELRAWKDWEKLVSKFPPIMRLRQGDNVLVWLSDDIHTVLGTDLASGKIHIQDVYGDADSYDPTGIKKWPWELEQKGGQQ